MEEVLEDPEPFLVQFQSMVPQFEEYHKLCQQSRLYVFAMTAVNVAAVKPLSLNKENRKGKVTYGPAHWLKDAQDSKTVCTQKG